MWKGKGSKEKQSRNEKGEMGRSSSRESYELRPMMTPTKCCSILPPMRGSKSSGSMVVGHGGDVENEVKREKEGRKRERGGDCQSERVVSSGR